MKPFVTNIYLCSKFQNGVLRRVDGLYLKYNLVVELQGGGGGGGGGCIKAFNMPFFHNKRTLFR